MLENQLLLTLNPRLTEPIFVTQLTKGCCVTLTPPSKKNKQTNKQQQQQSKKNREKRTNPIAKIKKFDQNYHYIVVYKNGSKVMSFRGVNPLTPFFPSPHLPNIIPA